MSQTSLNLQTNSLYDLPGAAKQIINFAGTQRIVLFYGDMGAGKTTLIKELCKTLGVKSETSSPTFSIVNEYQATDNTIYHFDFYRLKNELEALDLGYEEYFYSGAWCFVEWPEKIAGLLPDHYVKVNIETTGPNSREIIVTAV